MTEFLEPEQAITVVEHLGLHVRDEGLLFSALARPAASMFGVEAYPDFFEKAAALFSSLAQNHPPFDGNKHLSLSLTFAVLLPTTPPPWKTEPLCASSSASSSTLSPSGS